MIIDQHQRHQSNTKFSILLLSLLYINMAVDPEVVSKALDQVREDAPESLQQSLLEIEDFWDRKLWHQLTELLSTFFQDSGSESLRLPLFKKFILTFSEKINQLRFVSLGLAAASQCAGRPRLS